MLNHDYGEFLARKLRRIEASGLDRVPRLNDALFDFQRDVVSFLLRVGRGAAFLSTGLGKTICQLEWARAVVEHENRPVLILAPLAVTAQTVREATRFGIDAAVAANADDVRAARIYVTNYDKLDKFDPAAFAGVVLDESSILKNFNGATRRRLTDAFAATKFRLCCTATPAPNDHMELGQHAEFLGVCSTMEMLSRWFVNDTSEASQAWRLKGHAVADFWDWVCSWARCVSTPSDLGYSDDGFNLPPLSIIHEKIKTGWSAPANDGTLFRIADVSATAMHREKRLTVDARADRIAELVAAEPSEPWVIWCNTEPEQDALCSRLGADAADVRGSLDANEKERRLLAFSTGDLRHIVTKPAIAGFGLNWQHSARTAFVGLTYSWEQWHQSIRRVWRFGQTRPVNCHVVVAETESGILAAIQRKDRDNQEMKARMIESARRAQAKQHERLRPYIPGKLAPVPTWLQEGHA